MEQIEKPVMSFSKSKIHLRKHSLGLPDNEAEPASQSKILNSNEFSTSVVQNLQTKKSSSTDAQRKQEKNLRQEDPNNHRSSLEKLLAQKSVKNTSEKIMSNAQNSSRNFHMLVDKNQSTNAFSNSQNTRSKFEIPQLIRGLRKPDAPFSTQTESILNHKKIGLIPKKQPMPQNYQANLVMKPTKPPTYAHNSNDSNSLLNQIQQSKTESKDPHSYAYRKKKQDLETSHVVSKGRNSAKIMKNLEYNPDKSTSQISHMESETSNTMTPLFSYRLGNIGVLDRRVLYGQDLLSSINYRKISGGSFSSICKQSNELK